MPQRQLNVRSDEAFARASALANRLGKTTTEVVNEALKVYETRVEARDELGLTADGRRRYESIRRAVEAFRKHIPPRETFDDSWMYDENGLPK